MLKRENLLVVAGAFWLIAGVNVAIIGIQSLLDTPRDHWFWMFGFMAVVFAGFGLMFRRVSRKHAARILGHPDDRVSVLRTFDVKGYLIIAVMMGGGIALRAFNIVPAVFVGSFYPGLGTALALTGVGLLVKRFRRHGVGERPCPSKG
ncbi:hypothetical protein [uncultured Adlercreutzia sp.]|uniref:hypothetical protein n=1 Tax=uncultured Adlercreutzia sp. TaxID=875803 RepID=UPI0026F3E65B|nr:hypothetical protein [uncultured Adlercreutzia sp.]